MILTQAINSPFCDFKAYYQDDVLVHENVWEYCLFILLIFFIDLDI